jgi:tRNA A-37 threonylcarbamoyl transferase component Bud32
MRTNTAQGVQTMPTDNRQSDHRSEGLEQVAARIADEQPVNWGKVGEADAASLSGLREIEQLAQGFRHLQVSAVAPKTPTSNRFRFGALQVLELIGSGAQGEVWRAYDPLLDLQVALKLRKFDSDSLSHQFLEEARRLARVRQANIVSVYGAAVHDGRAGLWTELVRGSPLSELLAQHGPFPAEEVRGIGLDLCHALAAVHRHGVVHGDVKAENVMREVSGRIVLMDFGASREFDRADASVVSGTLRYLAPEVLRGAAPSPASDLYALGVLLFHLLCGGYPYAASDLDGLLAAQERKQVLRLAALKPGLPADLVRAIETALDLDPARRHASALALAAALTAKPARPSVTKSWIAMGAVAAIGVVLAGVLAWRSGNFAWQAQAEFQRVGPLGAVTLADGTAIAMGDRLVLQFHSNKPAFVYIFDDDGSGSTAVLFPLPGIEPANPLAAATSYRLPGRKDGGSLAWTVSSHAEREEFVVVAATAAQPELEQAIAEWQRAGGGAGASRGTLGLSVAPEENEIASAPLRALLRRVEQDNQSRHWRFVFPHGAK